MECAMSINAFPWELISLLALAAGAYLLWVFIRRLIRLIAEATEHTLPVVPRQVVEFVESGEKYLHVEGPRFTTTFFGISFGLVDDATGLAVPLKMVLLRAVTGGFSRARLLLKTFSIDHTGSYTLEIRGIKEGVDYEAMHIVITKPYRMRMTLHILGIIAGAWLAIGSIVLAILRFTHAL